MADANKITRMVEIAKTLVGEYNKAHARVGNPPADLSTLETWDVFPVDAARRQMADDGCDTTISEFQAAWETVNAWMEGMAEQRARDLYAIMRNE